MKALSAILHAFIEPDEFERQFRTVPKFDKYQTVIVTAEDFRGCMGTVVKCTADLVTVSFGDVERAFHVDEVESYVNF